MTGKIIKGIAGFYYVHDRHDKVYECKAKGIFRNRGIKPVVGDDVEFTVLDEEKLEGNIDEMWEKSDVRQVSFVYEDGSDSVSGFAEIKIQGTSSIDFVKKNYTLKFFEDETRENKLKIDVGWGPQNKY